MSSVETEATELAFLRALGAGKEHGLAAGDGGTALTTKEEAACNIEREDEANIGLINERAEVGL